MVLFNVAILKDIWNEGTGRGVKEEIGHSQLQARMGLLPPKRPHTFPSCYSRNSCCTPVLPKCFITWSDRCEPAAASASHGGTCTLQLSPGEGVCLLKCKDWHRRWNTQVTSQVPASQPQWQDVHGGNHMQRRSVWSPFLAQGHLPDCWGPSLDLGEALVPICTHEVSEATQTSGIWNLNTYHHKHWFNMPLPYEAKESALILFQGATAAGTKENRGGNTFLKPFPKHLHLHPGWQNTFTRYVTQGAEGFLISGRVRSQILSSKGAAGVSFYYLRAFTQLQSMENTNRRVYKILQFITLIVQIHYLSV